MLVPANLKERFEHTHIERFAEAPWTGEQVDLAPVSQKIRNQICLIHIIKILFTDFFKALDAHRQLFSHHEAVPSCSLRLFFAQYIMF